MAPLTIELSLIINEESLTPGHEARLLPSTCKILIFKDDGNVCMRSDGGTKSSSSFEQLKIINKNESRIILFMVRDLKVNKYYVNYLIKHAAFRQGKIKLLYLFCFSCNSYSENYVNRRN